MKVYKNYLVVTGLIVAVGTSCGKSSSDSSGNDLAEGAEHAFQLAPGALSIQIPTSLTNEKATTLRLEGPDMDMGGGGDDFQAPSANESQGYWELTEKMRRVQSQVAELTMNNAVLDVVMAAKCNFEESAECSASGEDACATVTADIMNSLKKNLGPARFEEGGELGKLSEKLDQKVCFESIAVKKESLNGFDYKAEITIDSDNKVVQYWNEAKDKVKVESEFKDSFAGFDGGPMLQGDSMPEFKGNASFDYDDKSKTVTVSSNFAMTFGEETNKGSETFTIKSLSDDENNPTVALRGSINDEMGGGNLISMYFEGKADDNGGYLKTQFNHSMYEVSKATLSANCEEGAEYWIYPKETSADDVAGEQAFFKQLGSFNCSQASKTLDPQSVFMLGKPDDAATDLVLFTVEMPDFGGGGGEGAPPGDEFDPNAPPPFPLQEDSFGPTLTASSVKFTELTSARKTSEFCYEEEFNKSGEMQALRAGEGKCSEITEFETSTGEFSEAYLVTGEEFKVEDEVSYRFVLLQDESKAYDLTIHTDNERVKLDSFPKMTLIYVANENCRGFSTASDLFNDQFRDECKATRVGTMVPKIDDFSKAKADFSDYTINFTGNADQFPVSVYFVKSSGQESRLEYRIGSAVPEQAVMIKN